MKDTVIKYGLLYAMGVNLSKGSAFRWSSNLSEAWRLNQKDIDWFKSNKKRFSIYELVEIENK